VQDRLVIPGESDDVRARRSRDELAWALIDLMREKDYDAISVQDVCAQAGVGRSTFYTHFADKDEMLIRHVVVFVEWMGGRFAWDARHDSYRFDLAFLLDHVRDMRAVFDSLARSRRIELITRVWQDGFARHFAATIRSARGETPQAIPAELLAQHIAGSVINLMLWWLRHHCPIESAEVDRHFHAMIRGLR